MIDIYFDNNALQFLCMETEFIKLLDLIYGLIWEKRLRVHNNPINFMEQFIGINAEHFVDVKHLMERFNRVTQFGGLLFPPKLHLLDSLVGLTEDQIQAEYQANKYLTDNVLGCNVYSDFVGVLGRSQEKLRTVHHLDLGQRKEIAEMLKDSGGFVSQGGETKLLDGMSKLELAYRVLVEWGLAEKVPALSWAQLSDKSQAFCYFIDTHWTYYQEICNKKRLPRKSDAFDISQVVYLDVCDYIVSSDRQFMEMLNGSENESLRNRVLTYDKFLMSLETFELPERAPNPGRGYNLTE